MIPSSLDMYFTAGLKDGRGNPERRAPGRTATHPFGVQNNLDYALKSHLCTFLFTALTDAILHPRQNSIIIIKLPDL